MVAYTGLEKVSSLTGLAKDPGPHRAGQHPHIGDHRGDHLCGGGDRRGVGLPVAPRPERPRRLLEPAFDHVGERTDSGPGARDRPAHVRGGSRTSCGSGWGLTAVAILLLAITTSISGFARMAESMGRHVQVPAVFARRSRRVLAAPAAIVAIGLLSAGFIVVASFFEGEETLTLASLYSFGILLAFTITQASIIWLRITEPDMPRAFMMHGNVRIRGRLIPLTSVAGALLSFAAWVLALGTHPGARIVGPLWMIARAADVHGSARPSGSAAARHGRSGRAAAGVGHRAAAGGGGRAAGAARPDRRGDDGDRLPACARCGLGGGGGERDRGSRCGIRWMPRGPTASGRWPRYRRRPSRWPPSTASPTSASPAAPAARGGWSWMRRSSTRRSLIVVGAPSKPRRGRTKQEEFFGRTVDFILRKAPCRVIVTHFPGSALDARRGARGGYRSRIGSTTGAERLKPNSPRQPRPPCAPSPRGPRG